MESASSINKMESAEIAALKGKWATAQAVFTRRANKLSLTVDILEKGDRTEEIRALSADFSRAHDSALELLEALEELDGEEAEGEKARIKSKINNCLASYRKTLQLARETLWSKFAEPELRPYAEGTEEKCDEVEAIGVEDLQEHVYEALREGLLERIHELEKKVSAWERIISDKVTHHNQLLYKLRNRARDWELGWRKSSRTPKQDPSGAGVQHIFNQPSVSETPPSPSTPIISKPQVSLERTRLPVFSGDMTEYYRWKTEWAELELLGNPLRTAGITRFHLLASLSEKMKRDLVLSSCATADEIFRRLDNRFGNKARIVLKIAEDVENLPPVKGNNPRKVIELIQAVERALSNLVILGEEDMLKNRLVVHSLERKLPSSLKEKWIKHKAEPLNGFSPHNHFDCLLLFLQKQEALLEELDQLDESPREGNPPAKTTVDKAAKAFSKATTGQRGPSQNRKQVHARPALRKPTLVGFSHAPRSEGWIFRVRKLISTQTGCAVSVLALTYRITVTTKGLSAPKQTAEPMNSTTTYSALEPCPWENTRRKANGKGLGLTGQQEDLLAKVAPELREEFRKAFSIKASAITCSVGNGPTEYPVVMMFLEVATNSGQLIGTIFFSAPQ